MRSDITAFDSTCTIVFTKYLCLRFVYFLYFNTLRTKGQIGENCNGSIDDLTGMIPPIRRIVFSVERTRDESDAASAKVLYFYAEDRETAQTFHVLLREFVIVSRPGNL